MALVGIPIFRNSVILVTQIAEHLLAGRVLGMIAIGDIVAGTIST